ncbi:glycosyltransferase [Methanococcoides burtonii]|uniref:Glycosyl transferase, family 2 n=1 Tax=Methanococcoides burtonii (strain DSM 6242 / NBRC 107633 / OCM 468 / ACE-M) TaxID=259564 RepID=Q12TX6_METBU|nr:glycosyltransferase [Methanococcoides burtonii]ABE53100.1 glycosyl transferase, family 2 [Methanococcoides burtonii DSM 6242]
MLSVIIPAYNEGHHIHDNLLEINDELRTFCDSFEIIFVNDGSTDHTLVEAKRAAEKTDNIKIISYTENQGKGNATIEGYKAASKGFISILDADLDIPPKQIEPLLKMISETGADFVIQSKRHPHSCVKGFPIKRRFLSRSYNLLIKLLFNLPVSDTQVGVKLYRKDVVNTIMPKLLVKRYAADVEQIVLAHKHGYKIEECPVQIDFDPAGDRMRLKDILNIAVDTAAIYYRLNILRYYDSDEIAGQCHIEEKGIAGQNIIPEQEGII